eukprot:6711547-Lingulodinium_polyedra.AAC.1
MVRSPFGPAAVDSGGRYLGAWLASAAFGALLEGERWTKIALDAAADGAWRRPSSTIAGRT